MRIGLSIHIGVNHYDLLSYKRYPGNLSPCRLPNCRNDAGAMFKIASINRFKSVALLDEDATIDNVLYAIALAARNLKDGDTFLLTFSGHGMQQYDINDDEEDGKDENWCLYDGLLLDDQLYECWKSFRPGVRIVVVVDGCHSGTSTKGIIESKPDPLKQIVRKTDTVKAACILLAACQDWQSVSAGDKLPYSTYTYLLLQVLEEGNVKSYEDLNNRISAKMEAGSKPNLYKFGPEANELSKKKPFTI